MSSEQQQEQTEQTHFDHKLPGRHRGRGGLFLDRPTSQERQIGEFHLHDGLNFRRLDDGSVMIRVTEDDKADSPTIREVKVSAFGWGSVVASVCKDGENAQTFQAALDLHDGSSS